SYNMVRQENIETASTLTSIIPASTVNSDHNSSVIVTQNNQPEAISLELIHLDISGHYYNPSSSSPKGNRRDYGRSQPATKGKGSVADFQTAKTVQGVPDQRRSVEKLHEFLHDCEKVPETSQYLQIAQLMASIDGKEKHDSVDTRKEEKQPSTTQKSVKNSSNSNMKKQPQAQNKGKGKAPATKPYSQGYRIPKIQQDAMENVFQMARTMMELQKKEEARLKFQK
ncbi:hypothetical protein O181_123907, partial [Austropuccinia psidii MF-1]|nr:hypothetical protein [Austropuccinia psidii MF-1]